MRRGFFGRVLDYLELKYWGETKQGGAYSIQFALTGLDDGRLFVRKVVLHKGVSTSRFINLNRREVAELKRFLAEFPTEGAPK